MQSAPVLVSTGASSTIAISTSATSTSAQAPVLAAPVLQAPVLQAPVLQAPVLTAPVILSVIYAVLSRIRICRNLRVFGANSLEPNWYLCYSNRFLHLWEAE